MIKLIMRSKNVVLTHTHSLQLSWSCIVSQFLNQNDHHSCKRGLSRLIKHRIPAEFSSLREDAAHLDL